MILKNKTAYLIAGILLSVFFELPLGAEVVLLKDGDVLTGKITREDSQQIQLQSAYGQLRIKPADVKFIIRDEKNIALENIQVGKKLVAARLVDETPTARVYISENNQIIRVPKEKGEKAKTTVAAPENNRNRIELRAGPLFSTLPYIGLDKISSGEESLKIRSNFQPNFFLSAAYKRDLTALWRIGGLITTQYARSSGSEGDNSFTISETYRYTGVAAGGSVEILLLRTLSHEISAGLSGGALYNNISIDLAYPDTDNPSGLGLRQNLTGTNVSPFASVFLGYAYKLNARLRLTGALTFRTDFYRKIYQNINGKSISEDALNDSLKKPLLNDFSLPMQLGFDAGVAYAW